MLLTQKQRPAALMVAKAPSTRSSARSHDSLPVIPKTSDVQDNGVDVFVVPDQDYRQHSKRTNAGTGDLHQIGWMQDHVCTFPVCCKTFDPIFEISPYSHGQNA